MSSYFGISGDASSFFTGYFGTSSTSSSGSSSYLGDYAMIRSGAYKKLLNAYYAKNTAETTEDTQEDKESKVNLTEAKSVATNLSKAATALEQSDFSNRDQETSNVQSFVDAYNKTIDTCGDSDTKSILHKTLWMIGSSNASTDLLNDVGITIGTDNKLSLNKETFKNADITSIKTLFSGTSSYAGKVASKASDLVNISDNAIKASTSGSTYTNSGDYSSINTNSLYNSLF